MINMVIFMCKKPRQDKDLEYYFEVVNLVFLVIFVIEATLKITCMGKKYFKDPYNVFDFIIISIGLGTLFL